MSYASILVAVDLADQAQNRIRLAARLADTFHAGLIGVAAEQPAYAIPPVGPTLASAYALSASSEVVLNDLRRAHAAFSDIAGGRSRVTWRSNLDDPLSFLNAQAAAADLVVVGRKTEPGMTPSSVDPGDLVMRLGRPVLVVPPHIDSLAGGRVVVGWRNTREARRAVSDALPFLKQASQVLVVSVDDGGGAADGQDILELIRAHAVHATALRRIARDVTAAAALIDVAAEQGADLIVAGAYGHGRLREWAFGGVTRTLLSAAPVCCLMSH
jgi:nucleotide-binding universal stress UspA family protein